MFYLFELILNKNNSFIKTCSGWIFNKLPEIKDFFKFDIQYFEVALFFLRGDMILYIMNKDWNKKEKFSYLI